MRSPAFRTAQQQYIKLQLLDERMQSGVHDCGFTDTSVLIRL